MWDYRAALRRWERAYFRSRWSRLFAELMSRKATHLYDRAADELGSLPPGSRLADIGCGHGTFLLRYLQRYPEAKGFGLDQSAELIRFADQQCTAAGVDCEFMVGDVHDAPLPAAAFDAMVSTSSIYCWHDPTRALDNLYGALKPGGRFLLWEMLPVRSFADAWTSLFDHKVYGLSLPAYTETEMREFVRRSRFQEAKVEIDRLIIRFEFSRPLADNER
ncbi:MAG: class I SAM-dependent methyltransferase [Candidatus Lernaella stagnicola]|nr:class I SAM-dependent methyltransferase [Candidatus Lernaella stagnicola]